MIYSVTLQHSEALQPEKSVGKTTKPEVKTTRMESISWLKRHSYRFITDG